MIAPQPFCFLPVVVLSHPSVLPRCFSSDSLCCAPLIKPESVSRERRATRKSLERINLLYLLLCYAIIKTEHSAGQKEIMVFTQRSRLVCESETHLYRSVSSIRTILQLNYRRIRNEIVKILQILPVFTEFTRKFALKQDQSGSYLSFWAQKQKKCLLVSFQ